MSSFFPLALPTIASAFSFLFFSSRSVCQSPTGQYGSLPEMVLNSKLKLSALSLRH